MYNCLKVRPKIECKPIGIDRFIDMFENFEKLEGFLDVPTNSLKFAGGGV